MKIKILPILIFFLLLANTSFILAEAPDIDVTLLNQDPDPAKQGEIVEVRFKIENIGTSTLEDVEIHVLPSYPFTLYSGTAIRKLGKLPASQTGADAIIIDYKLKVDERAIEGETELELSVKLGNQIFMYDDNEFLIDIEEYDTPEIRVYLRETDILQPNSKGTITIEIANVDEADIKFLQLTLLPSEDYKLISSSNYVYLGDVDSDDTESEEFDIFVKDVEEGKVNIPILLQYENSDETEYEEEFEIVFDVYTSGELSKYGIKKRSYTATIIVIIILAIIGYFYWKKRKKR